MPKRKNKDDSDDERKKKIKKLERRLAKYREKEKQSEDQTHELDPSLVLEPQEIDPELILDEEISDIPQDPNFEVISNKSNLENDCNKDLDGDFLSALGVSSSGEKQYGEEIHEEIFNTIKNILIDGMSKPNKDKLTESLLIPNNCKLLDAPKLNMELISVLSNPAKVRDKLLQDRQQELGLGIGNICQVINTLSKKEYDKLNIIKRLSDVSRILSNLHFQYTEIRRKLVNPSLDKNLAESLKENKRDIYLYSNLDESVKAFSAMKRASNALKPKSTTPSNMKITSKNFQPPPRRSTLNQGYLGRGSYRGGAQQRLHPRPILKSQDNNRQPNRGRARYP